MFQRNILTKPKLSNIAIFQKIQKENNFCFNEIILTKPKLSNIAIFQKMQKENNFCFKATLLFNLDFFNWQLKINFFLKIFNSVDI